MPFFNTGCCKSQLDPVARSHSAVVYLTLTKTLRSVDLFVATWLTNHSIAKSLRRKKINSTKAYEGA